MVSKQKTDDLAKEIILKLLEDNGEIREELARMGIQISGLENLAERIELLETTKQDKIHLFVVLKENFWKSIGAGSLIIFMAVGGKIARFIEWLSS